jgi:hypothetical protein
MSDERKIPQFASEAEEADWWYANREWLSEEFERAAKEGRLKRGSTVLERIRAAQQLLTVPLTAEDLSSLRDLARRHGADEQSYAGALLHEAIERQKGM